MKFLSKISSFFQQHSLSSSNKNNSNYSKPSKVFTLSKEGVPQFQEEEQQLELSPEAKREIDLGTPVFGITGDEGVGKQTILNRLTTDAAFQDIIKHLGIKAEVSEFMQDQFIYSRSSLSYTGREALRTFHGAIIVFDVTSPESLDSALTKHLHQAPVGKPIVLLGNKCDLGNRVISHEEVERRIAAARSKGADVAVMANVKYFETCMEDAHSLAMAYEHLVRNSGILKYYNQEQDLIDSMIGKLLEDTHTGQILTKNAAKI